MDRPERAVVATGGAEDRRGRGIDTKLNTLRDYRWARGLCIRCGKKRSCDHLCPEQIQLHVLQEVWDLCHSDDPEDSDSPLKDATESQVFLALSLAALSAHYSDSTMHFVGDIQGRPVKILLDSGSSNTFISTSLASQLQGNSVCQQPLKVTVANGSHMLCQKEFKQLLWSIQQCSFVSEVKVLPLSQYDLIVGMDWLMKHNPMEIDWKYKRILVTYDSEHVFSKGYWIHCLPDQCYKWQQSRTMSLTTAHHRYS
jgi:hypothetical protein